MKKVFGTIACATMMFALVGCSGREALSNDEAKAHLEKGNYVFNCSTTSDDHACLFSNESTNTAFAYFESLGLTYVNGGLYSVDQQKVIDKNGFTDTGKEELKKKFEESLKEVDVTQEELQAVLSEATKAYIEEEAAKKKELETKEFALGERVVIEQNGQEMMALTFNSATPTDQRNRFNDTNPEQVVFLNYTYENLNMEKDLYVSSVSFTVVGDDGTVATSYPVSGEYPQKCPKGANSTADEAYGFKSATTTIKVKFEMYINSEKVVRNFVLTVG